MKPDSINLRKKLLISLIAAVAVWVIFAWPLPKYMTSGIPSSSQNIEENGVRRMMRGDHLQLHYNFWLFSDMLVGKTPMFSNVYEFNTGEDKDRYGPGIYNMPFSLVYSAARLIGTRAFAWNLTGLISLWITLLCTWFLTRRYCRNELLAGALALIGITLPYRWVALLGGSPTGYTMMWIPVVLLGLDMAARDSSIKGGFTCMIATVLLYLNDRQTHYYVALFMPYWGVLALACRSEFELKSAKWWGRFIGAVLPTVVGLAYCVADATFVQKGKLAESVAGFGGGHTTETVGGFSPMLRDLFEWQGFGKAGHAHIGYAVTAIIAIGLVLHLFDYIKEKKGSAIKLARMVLLYGGLVFAVFLAVGPNGPLDGFFFKAARKGLPFYSKVRQTGKIFVMLPTLLAISAACGLSSLLSRERLKGALCIGFALVALSVGEHAVQSRATVCILDDEQAAYEAVAENAEADGTEPRAIIIPMWPGDSSWGSLYEHYVSLYRIRMINGYRPVITKVYKEQIYETFSSVNGGQISDAQLENLLGRGIRYVMLHEDAFPEQVCPFPVAFVIKRLLNHPRLSLLEQGNNIWAFKILDAPENRAPLKTEWDMFFPTRYYEFENSTYTNVAVTNVENDVCDRGYVTISSNSAECAFRAFRHWDAPDPALMIRARGHGAVRMLSSSNAAHAVEYTLNVDSDIWQWMRLPIADPKGKRLSPVFSRIRGDVDLDTLTFVSGNWHEIMARDNITIPASLMFHAGYMAADGDSVFMKADRQPDDAVLYGPKLPLRAGAYTVDFDFDSSAPDGTVLGTIFAATNQDKMEPVSVIAGRPAQGSFINSAELPVRFEFVFSRNADIEIRSVRFVLMGSPE